MDIANNKQLFKVSRFTSIREISIGSVIQFRYKDEDTDRVVLVLDPWRDGKMHCVKLDEVAVVDVRNMMEDFSEYKGQKQGGAVRGVDTGREVLETTHLYTKYKQSRYFSTDHYRTFIVDNIKNIREITIKG